MSVIEISDMAKMMAQRAEEICAEILPMGRREGREWVEASTARGGLGDALKVHLAGARAGTWKHFADAGSGGDMIDLVAYVLFSGDKKRAVAYAKSWLGLDNADPARLKQQRMKARAAAKKREEQAVKEMADKKRYAHSLWLNADPKLLGSPVDLYLLGRGIGLGDLPKVPGSLRYARALRHVDGHSYPAMVAAVNDGAGGFSAVHRTYLHAPAQGVVTKAPLGEKAKMVLGPYAGGFITLNRGASGQPLSRAPEGDEVVLCEGIEDGLSIALACPEMRVLAALSVSNFRNIILPERVRTVVLAADNDPPLSPAGKALSAAAGKFIEEGRCVMIARSPVGKDFNDCLRGDGAMIVSEARI